MHASVGICKLCLQSVYTGYHNYVFTATTFISHEPVAHSYCYILFSNQCFNFIKDAITHLTHVNVQESMRKLSLQVHTVEKKKHEVYATIHIRICHVIGSDSVLQAIYMEICIRYYNSLASCAFCREQGSDQAAADELSLRNAIIEQHSLKNADIR